MSRVECQSCGKWKYSEAVICPHCGARREGAKDPVRNQEPAPKKARQPLQVSKDEAKALLEVHDAIRPRHEVDESKPSTIHYLIWPQTSGNTYVWEIVLTVIAFPLIGLAIMATAWWSFRFPMVSTRGLARASVPVAALAAFCLAKAMEASTTTALITVGCMFLSWVIREVIRQLKLRVTFT
jgi:hypothetical protein